MLILHVNRMFRRVCIAKSWPLSKCFLECPKLISCILLFYIMYHFVQCISDQTHTARGRWCNCVQFHGLVLRFKIVIAALWTTRSLLNAKRDLGCTTVRLHILLSTSLANCSNQISIWWKCSSVSRVPQRDMCLDNKVFVYQWCLLTKERFWSELLEPRDLKLKPSAR